MKKGLIMVVCCLFLYSMATAADYDVSVKFTMKERVKVNNSLTITGELTNHGDQTITSFTMYYNIDGGSPYSHTFTSLTIPKGGKYNFTHPQTFTPTEAGKFHQMKGWAGNLNVSNNDENPSNDTAFSYITVNLGQSSQKMILLEVFANVKDGESVDAYVKQDMIVTGNNMVYSLTYLQGSSMATYEANDIISAFSAPFASGAIDRNYFADQNGVAINKSVWVNKIVERISEPAPVNITVMECKYDESIQSVNSSVSIDFTDYVGGDIRVSGLLIENNVTATLTTDMQRNAYNNTPGHPYYGKGDSIANFVHQKVVRAFLSDRWGYPVDMWNPQPHLIRNDTTINFEFAPRIIDPYTWKIADLYAYFFVHYYSPDPNKREVINIVRKKVGTSGLEDEKPLTTTGIDRVYPNPLQDVGLVEFTTMNDAQVSIQVLNSFGQVLQCSAPQEYNAGQHCIGFDVYPLNEGIYYIVLNIGGRNYTSKFIKSPSF